MPGRLLLCLLLLLPVSSMAGGAGGKAMLVPVEGGIGPATADWVARSLERAVEQQSRLVILQLDTPGGLDASMRRIVKSILASPVPVVGFVAPPGARAASAGTYILYACHMAAMAPGTNLGAATPVRIGAGAPTPSRRARSGDEEGGDDIRHKVVNDAAAYLRGLAELRGRNADWAERAVREGASLPAREALET